ncbi:MAG: hypothetical protein Q9210_005163 [Variospora velana]
MATGALGSALTGAAVQMIGPINETLTQVVQFSILDFFASSSGNDSNPQNTLVRIRAGADDNGAQQDLGGDTPIVVGWETNLNWVGDSRGENPGHISNGHFANVEISGGRQTPTLDFTAGGTNGICISDVYMKWADNQGFAFDGSWFKWCNMWWYHSSISLTTSSGGQFQPPYGVDMLKLQNIPNQNAWGKDDVQSYCTKTFQLSGSKQFQYLKGNLDTTGTKPEKRALSTARSTANATISVSDESGHRRKLVVSNYEGQSAQGALR